MQGLIIGIVLFIMQANAVETHLNELLKDMGYSKYEYEIVSMPSDYKSVNEAVLDPNAKTNVKGGFAFVPVLVKKQGTSVNSMMIIKLRLYRKVAVALKDMERKSIPEEDFFIIDEREVSSLATPPVTAIDELKGVRLRVPVKKGTIIEEIMIEKNPDVITGSKVTAFLRFNSVEVSLEATAKQDGAVGEVIRVEGPGKRIYKAEVVSSEFVNIKE